MSSPCPHVLILGAGLGGLLLAQALRKQGIPFQIFERDNSLHSRTQGWCVGIHSLFDELSTALPDDLPPIETTSHLLPLDLPAQLCFYGHGQKFFVQDGAGGRVIRANRSRLRAWLVTRINVQWGKKTIRIEETSDAVTLHFADGSSATGDILVGADGVNSIGKSTFRTHIFRNQATPTLSAIPQGVIVAETTLTKPQLSAQLSLAHSAYVALGSGFFLFVGLKAIADDAQSATYYWFVVWNDEAAASETEEYWTASATRGEILGFAKRKTEALEGRFSEIVKLTKEEEVLAPPLVIMDLDMRRVGIPVSRSTILGDAAHPMTPFRGEGGSNAMLDALRLAGVLARSGPGDLLQGLKGYQEEMLKRGGEAVERSRAAAGGEDSSRFAWGQSVRLG